MGWSVQGNFDPIWIRLVTFEILYAEVSIKTPSPVTTRTEGTGYNQGKNPPVLESSNLWVVTQNASQNLATIS